MRNDHTVEVCLNFALKGILDGQNGRLIR